MTIRPITFETPTGHREPSWGVYDDDGRLLAPCGSREVAQGNIDKLIRRYPEGFDPERSRNREAEV